MSQTIELYIDQIVLHGMEGRNRFEIGNAIEEELSRLLSQGNLPATFRSGGGIDILNGSSFQYNNSSRSNLVGEHIAGSIFQTMTTPDTE
ncbi:MAG TPA: hypothetical protein VL098_14445 [Flavipsychrobacter sp.]|nr:hypothetical protein [Flavipsychrobacter sp.]